MYYYNHNDDNRNSNHDNNHHSQNDDNDFNNTTSNNNNNDDPYLSHSLDSMFRSQNQQDWSTNNNDDTFASYLSLGLHAHSLDSPFFNDAFGQFPLATTTATAGDWDVLGDQQQQQQQPLQDNDNNDSSSHDFSKFQHGPTDDLLNFNEQAQQAILLSDPNFVRQQQLLQEQQKQMELRMQQEQQQEDTTIATAGTANTSDSTISTSAPVRSNLSAMFGHATLQQHQQQQSPTEQQQQVAADTNTAAPSAFAAAAVAAATAATTVRAKKPSAVKKDSTNRRSSSSTASSSSSSNKRNTNPVPNSSSSASSEVDHQRRLNELQARFRVNYARKPNQRKQQQQQQQQQQQSQHQQHQQAILGTSFEPSSLPNFSSNHNAQAGLERRRSASITVDPPQRQQPTMRIGRMPRAPVVSTTNSSTATNATNATRVTAPSSSSSSTAVSSTATTNASTNTTAAIVTGATAKTNNSSTGATTTAPYPSRTMPIQIQRVARSNGPLQLDKEQRQRKLDEQLERVDFDDITVSELKEMLRQRGRPATGKKAVLVQRLLDERELIKAIKSGRAPASLLQQQQQQPHHHHHQQNQRHSLPAGVDIPLSSSATSSSMMGTTDTGQHLQQHASSVPNVSGFPPPPPGPGSPGSSLNRSIANMHIGSPPIQSRRFAPYSPTTRTMGSPKQQHQQQLYSSSMPINNYLTPMDEKPRVTTTAATTTQRYPRHKYAPRTPSALATPDHDEELNPFDQYIMMHQQHQQQQQQQQQQQLQQEQQQAQPQPIQQHQHQLDQQDISRVMDMEWDHSILDTDFPQQDGGLDISRLTQEELLQLFTSTDMALDNTFL
ncbi:hypothetical protein BDB00DRAFT_813873 [Zychaea mexicana]|uniref:uncharacterized protein n=1 Tax=Zychaea mexicana TaxID=64656 RepID=UPI0022FDE288|nr:uncharacterized protein BDB00DRAFT_813873 [Zychaea mexicana]KAI9495572.1 hypothetical protein BDB00DRAFT_813873 [Zychaea mexicana]